MVSVRELTEIPDVYRNFDLANIRQWAGPDHWKFPTASRATATTTVASMECVEKKQDKI